MKNRIILILTLQVIAFFAFGQDTINSIAYQNVLPISTFEDRDTSNYFYIDTINNSNNIWQIGKPNKIIFNNTYSPMIAIVTDTINYYPINNKSSFEFVIHSNDVTSISFWHKYNTDSLRDGGFIEASLDGGNTWENVINMNMFTVSNFYKATDTILSYNNKPGFTGNSDWINSSINGREFRYIRFRFTFTSDNFNSNNEGWMLDNFRFYTVGTGIYNKENKKYLTIFPSPTSNQINIVEKNNLKIEYVLLKNSFGKDILTSDKNKIDLSNNDSGIYFIEIFTNKGTFVDKIIKQ